MLGPSVKRLARLVATRPLEKAGMVLVLAAMVVSAAAAALLLLACPASPRCSTAVGSALSAPKKLWGCGASVSPEASAPGAVARECDFFDGEWVRDDSYPLYESKDCSFLDGGFRCSENGRPDTSYTRWRWQPSCCDRSGTWWWFMGKLS